MKILEVREIVEFIVETDQEVCDTYRTDGQGNWEILLDGYWCDYRGKDIQRAWEDYMK